MSKLMKTYYKLGFLSLVVLLSVASFIYAKADPTTSLFTPSTFTKQNLGVMTNINAQQLTNLLQSIAPQSSSGGGGVPSADVPQIVHRVSGNFRPGGQVLLEVIGSPSQAGFPFIIIFSTAGDFPGLTIPGIEHIPLNPPYPLIVQGTLGPNGHAQMLIPLPQTTGICGVPLTTVAGVLFPTVSFSNPVTYDVCKGLTGFSCCTQGAKGIVGSQCIDGGVSVNYCRKTISGAVQECIPKETIQDPPPGAPVNFTIATINNSLLANLTRDIGASNISSRVYNATTYDCDDFADDLEQWLQNLSYDATYTYFIKYKDAIGTVDYSHAVTDIHLPDGSLIFIEPQTGKIINLDFDGDGKVGANRNLNPYKNGYHPTDDNAKISVYNSAAAATAAGAPRD